MQQRQQEAPPSYFDTSFQRPKPRTSGNTTSSDLSYLTNGPSSNVLNTLSLASMLDPITPEFKLKFPPNKIFTPQFNEIKGSINLFFKETLQGIHSIDISIFGDSLIVLQNLREKKKYYQNYKLFKEEVLNLFTSLSEDGTDINKGESLTYDFKLQFPDPDLLVSSCDKLNSSDNETQDKTPENYAFINIRYFLRLKVQFHSYLDHLEYIEFNAPLMFQGDDVLNNWNPESINEDFDRFLFQKKVKQYVFDKKQGKMVHISNLKSGGLGKIFNSQKKSKEIELRISIPIPQMINLQMGLFQIPLIIELPCSLIDYQHFKINGESTRLGFFNIKQLIISLNNYTVYNVMFNKQDGISANQIYNNKEYNLNFDAADFHFDDKAGCFVWDTTIQSLIDNTNPLVEQFQFPVMNTIKLKDYFRNINVLRISMHVGNGQEKDRQAHWFYFKRNVQIISRVPSEEVDEFYSTNANDDDFENIDYKRVDIRNDLLRDPNCKHSDGKGGGVIDM